MVQMQKQLLSGIEREQHLCFDWLIAAMGSVRYCYNERLEVHIS